ncbi:MAG: class II aldolase/adducin family protein [Anaerolineae bacterium]|nr:class II aldolase/adducin family protein [Thermoflexales bacterium]MDW8395624.1 class II aldolase/adducin family protein [Anaerolineae bacterium]
MVEVSPAVEQARAQIAAIGRLLYERRLTDAAGGNISVRVGDLVCLTPRYSGSKRRWQLCPDDVLVVDLEGNRLAGEGDLSRESKVHLRLYREFPDGTAVIHAHPQHVLVFCVARQPIPPVLEATLKFGTIPVIPFAPAHSADLAEFVAQGLRGQEARIRKQAAAVLAPWHGIFCIGKDLDATYDAVERIDTNARLILMSRALITPEQLAREQAALLEAVAKSH